MAWYDLFGGSLLDPFEGMDPKVRAAMIGQGLLGGIAGGIQGLGEKSRTPVGFMGSFARGLGGSIGGVQQGQSAGMQNYGRMAQIKKLQAETDREKGWNTLFDTGATPGEATDPAAAALRGPFANLSPEQRELVRMSGPERGPAVAAQFLNRETATPIIKDFIQGGETVQKQFNPQTRTWEEVGRGSRFAPQQPQREPMTPYQFLAPDGTIRYGTSSQVLGQQAPPRSSESIRFDEQGRPIIERGPNAGQGTRPMTEQQSRDATFSDRMLQSENILKDFEKQGANFWGRMKENVPIVGNYLQTDDYQKFEQARRDFINAQLRRESGAVITPQEFENADRQYFPRPGDSDAVIEQKRANRKAALEGMVRGSGPSYNRPAPTAPASPSVVPQAQAAPVPGAKQAADGKWYVPDPNRPGKYLQVVE